MSSFAWLLSFHWGVDATLACCDDCVRVYCWLRGGVNVTFLTGAPRQRPAVLHRAALRVERRLGPWSTRALSGDGFSGQCFIHSLHTTVSIDHPSLTSAPLPFCFPVPLSAPSSIQGDVAVGRANKNDVADILAAVIDEPSANGKTFEMITLQV